MLESGFASAEDIDTGMVIGCAHPLGPLALTDLIGLDTTLAVAESLYEEFKEPHLAPPPAALADDPGGAVRPQERPGVLLLQELAAAPDRDGARPAPRAPGGRVSSVAGHASSGRWPAARWARRGPGSDVGEPVADPVDHVVERRPNDAGVRLARVDPTLEDLAHRAQVVEQ